jgi:hypothetical protein
MRIWPASGLWRHADFLRLWAAQSASAVGSRISRTALPIIAILTIKATPTEIAILSALGVAPGVVVGLFAGGRIDRTAKRPLMIGADLVRAILIATIPAAAWFGRLSMLQLYGIAAAVGAATTLFQIADSSFLPILVDSDALVEGNAKLEASDSVAEAAGPGLAGVLVQLLTAPGAMIIDALTYLWSAFMLGRIRAEEPPPVEAETRPTVLSDIAAGFRACMDDSLVGPLLLAEATATFFGGFFMALYMILCLQTLELSPAATGLIISCGGVGAVGGALIAQPLGRRWGVWPAMVVCLAIGQAGNLFIALAPDVRSLAAPLLVAQQLIGDAFMVAYAIHAISLRQQSMPAAVLARSNATFHVASGLMLPAGALLAGPLAGMIGTPATLWIGACGTLLAAPMLVAARALRPR